MVYEAFTGVLFVPDVSPWVPLRASSGKVTVRVASSGEVRAGSKLTVTTFSDAETVYALLSTVVSPRATTAASASADTAERPGKVNDTFDISSSSSFPSGSAGSVVNEKSTSLLGAPSVTTISIRGLVAITFSSASRRLKRPGLRVTSQRSAVLPCAPPRSSLITFSSRAGYAY